MRICLTHYAFYPTTGGVESHLLDLGAELVQQGHEVYALVGSLEGSAHFDIIQGVKVCRRGLMDPFYVRARKAEIGFPAEVVVPSILREIRMMYEAFIQENRIEVVHAHNFHQFLPDYALALTELHNQGLPTLLTIHEVWSEFICEDVLERAQWDAVITVSRHVAEDIRQQAPQLKNIHLIYHGIDTTLFSPTNGHVRPVDGLELKGRPVIIHPAQMLPWKGVLDSVLALEKVREEFPEAVLIITDTEDIVDWVGERGGYKQEVLKTIKNLKLENHVLTQSFPFLELPAVYRQCQVVIYPTIGDEPFGLVPVEAMACAKPVIVTKSGGLVESVVDGVTGFVIEKQDVDALAEKIRLLLRDKFLAQRMGEAGRQHALKQFSRRRMARQAIEIYEVAQAKKKSLARPLSSLILMSEY